MSHVAASRPTRRHAGRADRRERERSELRGRRGSHAFTGFWTMCRFFLRRNWVRMLVWIIVLTALVPATNASQREAFPTEQSREEYAQIANTPAVASMTGLPYAADTYGGILVIKLWMTIAVAAVFAVIFLVTRNGRADEEAGRTELLRAGVLGRHAAILANVTMVSAFGVVLGGAIGTAAAACDLDIGGSVVLGGSIAGLALAFVGITALCGQLTLTPRGANTIAALVLAAAYLVRAIADVEADGSEPHPLSWASPIGWAQNMRPYGDESWWPFALLVGLGVGGCCVALAIEARRDLGAGVLPQRPGAPRASALLVTPIGLVLRLERSALIGWLLGLAVSGAFLGGIVTDMADMVDSSNPYVEAFTGGGDDVLGSLVELFLLFNALLVGGFAVQCASRVRLDEASGRLEAQLAGSLSRWRVLAATLSVAVVWSVILLVVSGTAMGAAFGRDGAAGRFALAALGYLPSVAVVIGLVAALTAVLPRAALAVSWSIYGASAAVAMFGGVFGLADEVIDATVFAATPKLLVPDVDAAPLVVLSIIAAVLVVIGMVRFRQRDLTTA